MLRDINPFAARVEFMKEHSPEREGNFSQTTRQLLADRAGHECSLPYCTTRTVGPGASETQTAKVGQASHIYSAAKDGPRGRGGKTPEQLADAENGIWTCELHGKEVDNNKGKAFPAGLLKSWKSLHEARVRRASTGASTKSWIESIRIKRSPLIEPDSFLRLGQVTVIGGNNGVGKTAICEWVAGFRDHRPLERWTKDNAHYALNIEISYVAHKDHTLGLKISKGEAPKFYLDGNFQPIPPSVIDVVYLPYRYLDYNRPEDLRSVAALFSITPEMAIDVAESVGANGNRRFREICFEVIPPNKDEPAKSAVHEDGSPYMRMIVETYSPPERFPLAAMGGGVHTEILLAMASELARFKSRHAPTLLMLEGGDWGFAHTNFTQVADAIDHCSQDFQVLLVEPSGGLDDDEMKSREWVSYRLVAPHREVSFGGRISKIENT